MSYLNISTHKYSTMVIRIQTISVSVGVAALLAARTISIIVTRTRIMVMMLTVFIVVEKESVWKLNVIPLNQNIGLNYLVLST